MNKLNLLKVIGAVIVSYGLVSCSEQSANQSRGVYMLLDTSGTYTQELEKAQQVINVILAKMNPGDSFAVARIDTASFSEKDIVAKVTFDDRPSMTNKQKRVFKESIDKFVKGVDSASYTDITGGVLQAIEYLREKGTGKNTILIYSDLKEEIKEGYNRDVPLDLLGFDLVALNVTKLRTDNIDPNQYLGRLADWKKKVEINGGEWRVINDMERLEKILPN
ncbi:MAG: hypothetical protein V2I33_11125 [Kangiellaceae bacterium]|jgi:hypothetical protein|nr:hypothetical protein [Kangiellaceae bacterium]